MTEPAPAVESAARPPLLRRGWLLAALVIVGTSAMLLSRPDEAAMHPQSSAAPAVPEVPALPPIVETVVEVRRNDSPGAIFERAGVGPREFHAIVSDKVLGEPLRKIFPGEALAVQRRGDALARIEYRPDVLRTWVIEPKDGGFAGRWVKREFERRAATREVAIDSSLYASALQAGFSEKLVLQVAEIFGWDIDFALDIRRGDRVAVLFDELWLDGKRVRDGEVIAARFVNGGKVHEALRFARADGSAEYFDRNGRSMRKEFLRTPVDFRRISSGFKSSRFHPVLGIKRPHQGVDYAAAIGTPVRSTGDGKVLHVGDKGGYGRTVIIRHGQNVETLYAHLNGYAKGMRAGKSVRQGETIGYLGKSGLATGPHLHYEFRLGGVHRNPLTVKLPDAAPLPLAERPQFDDYAARILRQVEELMDPRLAKVPEPPKPAG